MNAIAIVSTNKDATTGGIAVIDISNGSSTCTNFKNSVCEPGQLCSVNGTSSYSGCGAISSGDFIVAAQSGKPVIHVYQWGKPQIHYTCHIQEVTTAIACDSTGIFLFGGTKKGWMYIWELSTGQLLTSWQGHFKEVKRILLSPCNNYFVSSSDDGVVKVWDIAACVDQSSASDSMNMIKSKKIIQPYRSYSPHTLAVKDLCISGVVTSPRIVSCSLDKSVVIFDIHSNKKCYSVTASHPLESIALNISQDTIYAGASNGDIFIFDLSVAAIALSAAHSQIVHTSSINSGSSGSSSSGSSDNVLIGHTRAVSSMSFSSDNCTLVSASRDGSLRVWDVVSRQCLRDLKPLNKLALTNVILVLHPEQLLTGVTKVTTLPFEHLKKYSDSNGSSSSSSSSSSNTDGNSTSSRRLLLGCAYLNSTSCNSKKSSSNIVSDAILASTMSHSSKGNSNRSSNMNQAKSKRLLDESSDDFVAVASNGSNTNSSDSNGETNQCNTDLPTKISRQKSMKKMK